MHFKSLLVFLPITEVPFKSIAMDLIRPLLSRGKTQLLIVLDYATQDAETYPLRNMSSKVIVKMLFHTSPKEILTDHKPLSCQR